MWRDLLNWGLAVLGIALTAIFFVIQYRQSVGARTERQAKANQELIELLVRRLILESYFPDPDDLRNLREGVAIRSNIDPADLISNHSIYSAVTFQVIENNYITPERRADLLKKLRQIQATTNLPSGEVSLQLNSKGMGFPEIVEKKRDWLRYLGGLVSSVGLALAVTSFLSSAVDLAAVPTISVVQSLLIGLRNFGLPIAIGGGLLAIAVAALIVQRTAQKRDALNRISSKIQEMGQSKFEQAIVWRLQHQLGEQFSYSDTENYDGYIHIGTRTYIVEIKSPAKALSTTEAERLLEGFLKIVQRAKVNGGVLVLPSDSIPADLDGLIKEGAVELVTEKSLSECIRALVDDGRLGK